MSHCISESLPQCGTESLFDWGTESPCHWGTESRMHCVPEALIHFVTISLIHCATEAMIHCYCVSVYLIQCITVSCDLWVILLKRLWVRDVWRMGKGRPLNAKMPFSSWPPMWRVMKLPSMHCSSDRKLRSRVAAVWQTVWVRHLFINLIFSSIPLHQSVLLSHHSYQPFISCSNTEYIPCVCVCGWLQMKFSRVRWSPSLRSLKRKWFGPSWRYTHFFMNQ